MSLHGVSTSDWHLGGMQRVLQHPVESMIREIKKPYEYALSQGIKHVFVPGDISDSHHMDDHTFIQLLTLLLTYDGHIKTWYIRGNHDVAHKYKTSLDALEFMATNNFFKNFRVFGAPKVVNIEDVSVGFIPFPGSEVSAKRPPLIFAHVEEPGAVGDNGRPLKVKEGHIRRRSGDYMITGHIHQYQVLEDRRTLYNGSLYQKTFGESLPKGFVDFKAEYVQGKLEVQHEFVNSHPNFELRNLTVKKSSDWSKIVDDPNIRYKVIVDKASGVIVPKDIALSRPNIVYINGSDSLVKVKDVHDIDGQTIATLPKFNPIKGLRAYLERSGLDDSTVKLGIAMTKEAWKHLTN